MRYVSLVLLFSFVSCVAFFNMHSMKKSRDLTPRKTSSSEGERKSHSPRIKKSRDLIATKSPSLELERRHEHDEESHLSCSLEIPRKKRWAFAHAYPIVDLPVELQSLILCHLAGCNITMINEFAENNFTSSYLLYTALSQKVDALKALKNVACTCKSMSNLIMPHLNIANALQQGLLKHNVSLCNIIHTSTGRTTLHEASMYNNHNVMKVLLTAAGNDVEELLFIKDGKKCTAFHKAAVFSTPKCLITMLLFAKKKAGALLMEQNDTGKTALDLASLHANKIDNLHFLKHAEIIYLRNKNNADLLRFVSTYGQVHREKTETESTSKCVIS